VKKDEEKRKKKDSAMLFLIICLLVCILFASVYMMWMAATSRMSAHVACKINQIDYVRLDARDGNGTCQIALVEGDIAYCALPKDIYCEGDLADFPLMRWVVEHAKAK